MISRKNICILQFTIEIKTNIIGQIFIKIKYCVWGVEVTKFCFE